MVAVKKKDTQKLDSIVVVHQVLLRVHQVVVQVQVRLHHRVETTTIIEGPHCNNAEKLVKAPCCGQYFHKSCLKTVRENAIKHKIGLVEEEVPGKQRPYIEGACNCASCRKLKKQYAQCE